MPEEMAAIRKTTNCKLKIKNNNLFRTKSTFGFTSWSDKLGRSNEPVQRINLVKTHIISNLERGKVSR